MKKTYIAPEMEIKKFSVEDIMTTSANTSPVVAYGADDITANGTVVAPVEYSQLFGI